MWYQRKRGRVNIVGAVRSAIQKDYWEDDWNGQQESDCDWSEQNNRKKKDKLPKAVEESKDNDDEDSIDSALEDAEIKLRLRKKRVQMEKRMMKKLEEKYKSMPDTLHYKRKEQEQIIQELENKVKEAEAELERVKSEPYQQNNA